MAEDSKKKKSKIKPVKNPSPKDFTVIKYDEIVKLSKTENPTVKTALNKMLDDIDKSGLSMEEIDKAYFERPIIRRTVIDEETGKPVEVDQYIGFQDSAESMHLAKTQLEEKGVSAPSGGGGGGGSYYISEIDSDQWQRIRRGEIDEEQAEWENDPDNYDEYGDMYDYFDTESRDAGLLADGSEPDDYDGDDDS
tara:strand:- start:2626 stop:3207 length:582 start_codon:yes stop_codon:yes gene_type:complete